MALVKWFLNFRMFQEYYYTRRGEKYFTLRIGRNAGKKVLLTPHAYYICFNILKTFFDVN